AFGPNVALLVGALKPTRVDGLLETNIDLTIDGNKQTVRFYVSKDGKFLFQGELSDMTKDPLAQNLAQIQMTDAPSMGDPSAAVNASRANGQLLDVNSTPTVFVNGRRMVGADAHLLEQYINYELAQQKSGTTAQKK